MNRIKLGPQGILSQAVEQVQSTSTPTSSNSAMKSIQPIGEFGNTGSNHATFVPLHYEKKYAYPLIVWLHEDGGDEHSLPEVMFDVSMRNYMAVAPRGPETGWESGFSWPQTSLHIQDAFDSTFAAIDNVCSRFNINAERIFLAGTGAGGTMAFRLAFMKPEMFAGVIAIHGQVPQNHSPFSRLRTSRDLPVFWAHDRQCSEFTEPILCEQLKLMYTAGFAVTLRQYPQGCQMPAQAWRDVNVWIMDFINGTDELSARADLDPADDA